MVNYYLESFILPKVYGDKRNKKQELAAGRYYLITGRF
jgi:hypothetical protein